MHFGEFVYEIGTRAAVPLAHLAAPLHDGLQRAVAGRAAARASLRAWAAAERDPKRPLLWLHAPSVGEALMAQAILADVKAQRPALQTAFTFFSPSAERFAPAVGADWSGYLPWDTPRTVRAALDVLQPDCIAFVRTEIWPMLLREAQQHGVRAVLVNAVLGAGSSRLRASARLLLGNAYRSLQAVGAVSDEDAARFGTFGLDGGRVQVTGDARFDQVVRRVQAIDRSRPLLRSLAESGRPWLVAGSTWPDDDERIVRALRNLSARGTGWRAIMAPHEPTSAHLTQLEQLLDAAKIRHGRLPADDEELNEHVPVLIVDRVGVLADLYAVADIAYVGGGFGDGGLHSVVEPAALGVPVLYGPQHGNAREAAHLAAAGGGIVVRNDVELRDALINLITREDARLRKGTAARAFVDAHKGGAAANAAVILEQLQVRSKQAAVR